MAIQKVGVVGAGSMGGGIAHLAAMKGFEVVLCDVEQRFLDAALGRMGKLMDKNIEKQKMTLEEKVAILTRIITTTNLEDLSSVDYVIEAVIEDLDLKKSVFEKLDKICKPEVILGTNTSSMSITVIAAATNRPDKVVGVHFFNPPQVMRLAEIIRGHKTSDETLITSFELAEALGKTPVEVKKDTPGFIVNRVMMPQFLEAVRLVEEGVATPKDIDTAVTLGLNYPMGPFTLMDFTGIDISMFVAEYFYNETKNPNWNPPFTLKSIVRAGRLGKKTNAGWYDYDKK
ncbi:3-hydroxyacyl-CoA dehydrogenase family protein [Desulfotomaculum sp. 1211_IL3151]|uniref:3-hydroxyacyl-CoA dehydrogenase family protein n=1 Tax=Desulfotomaculum sp. 1211_IL3151 TaxID=3084055 RepID=UPI002FD90B20